MEKEFNSVAAKIKSSNEEFIPQIKFYLDKEEDEDLFLMFWRDDWIVHDELSYLKDEKDESKVRQIVKNFTDDFYSNNDIKTAFEAAKIGWMKLENSFYEKTKRLLSGHPWPKGEYKALGSIWKVFPRDIEDKFFTFPINPSFKNHNPNGVIAHEMLHFIVYDYLEKKFGLEPSECYGKKDGSKDNKFWQFTENLNVLIENSEIWKEFMAGEVSGPKENCKELFSEMEKIWKKNDNIDNLVREIFKDEIKKTNV